MKRVIASVLGALLCVGVAYIHVKNQGGFPGGETPTYLQIGDYLLEATALVTAVALLKRIGLAWFLALGVGAGPFLGYVLTRTVGLPGKMDDKGNWGEPLGVASLIVEGVLILLAAVQFARVRPSHSTTLPRGQVRVK